LSVSASESDLKSTRCGPWKIGGLERRKEGVANGRNNLPPKCQNSKLNALAHRKKKGTVKSVASLSGAQRGKGRLRERQHWSKNFKIK